jgi:dTDP-4-dehydrorhamnose 3,5-epimerase
LAHGFLVTSESAEFLYKTTDFYYPEHERCIIWNDPLINIKWPHGLTPRLSDKDRAGLPLASAAVFG